MFQKRRNVNDNNPQSIPFKIKQLLSKNPHDEFNAKHIATLIKSNTSSTRSALCRLVREGYVVRTHRGFYKWSDVSELGYGLGNAIPRIHNMILVCHVPNGVDALRSSPKEYKLFIGDVKLRFSYGVKRRKITVYVSCDTGLAFREFKLVIELIRSYILRFYGFEPKEDELLIASYELNEDYVGLRMEGVKCLTASGLGGFLERIYQKRENLVRNEIKAKNASVEAVYTLLKGGVTPYNIVQGLFMLVKKLEGLVEAIKYLNQVNLEVRQVLLKILEKLDRT